jgi:mono/diheme cytochrome c family protein
LMTLLRVMLFSLFVLLSYTLFANILPQVQSDPPVEEAAPSAEGMDLPAMAAWGEKLFSGKGTCTLCHNAMGRAPDLLTLDLAQAFADRLTDPNYRGAAKGESGAKAIEIYLRESFVEPSVYVVAGFGKKGTDDKVSPMPAVDKAPISLKPTEIDAVIAFLQDRAGSEMTVPLPSSGEADADTEEEDEEEAVAETAEAAIEKFTCAACHDLDGSEADVGPELKASAARLGRAGLMLAILDPNAEIAEGFEADMMPEDYAEQMRVSEMNLIIDYLLTQAAAGETKE